MNTKYMISMLSVQPSMHLMQTTDKKWSFSEGLSSKENHQVIFTCLQSSCKMGVLQRIFNTQSKQRCSVTLDNSRSKPSTMRDQSRYHDVFQEMVLFKLQSMGLQSTCMQSICMAILQVQKFLKGAAYSRHKSAPLVRRTEQS